jgi:hypothetical protein
MVEITERAIALAVTQERERCARVCEETMFDGLPDEAYRLAYRRGCNDAARRIREEPTP